MTLDEMDAANMSRPRGCRLVRTRMTGWTRSLEERSPREGDTAWVVNLDAYDQDIMPLAVRVEVVASNANEIAVVLPRNVAEQYADLKWNHHDFQSVMAACKSALETSPILPHAVSVVLSERSPE